MQYRTMPTSKDKLSVLGFGCMRFPTKAGRIDEKKAEAMLLQAYNDGVNYFDTAVPYHLGQSEAFLGQFLEKNNLRDKVFVATKLPHWQTANEEAMYNTLKKQLKKLRTTYIDYYLVHNLQGDSWDKCVDNGVINFLNRAKEEGLIRYAGFSFHGVLPDFKRIVDAYPWHFTQIQYNFLDQKNQAGTEGLEYAAAKNLGIIIMEPLRGGNLAAGIPQEVMQIWSDTEKPWSPVEWALRWIWDRPEVHVILSGMSLPEHVSENVRIASEASPKHLSADDHEKVQLAASTYLDLMKVGCTACRYCMPCPFGVNIPDNFLSYNEYHFFKKKPSAKIRYHIKFGGLFGATPSFASQCTSCGACVSKCPQNLDIPVLLKDVQNEMEVPILKPIISGARKILSKRRRK